MDVLEIRVGSFTYGADKEATPTAEIYINGCSFCEMIDDLEKIYATDGYWGHAPITMREMFEELTFWCRMPDYDKEATILGCGCGVKECSPLAVKVEETENVVIWHSFSNEHRPEWKYFEIEPCVFDRCQYYGELRKLRDSIRSDDWKNWKNRIG